MEQEQTKVWSLNETVDLGTYIIGIFTTEDKAKEGKVRYEKWLLDYYAFEAGQSFGQDSVFIEEYILDQIEIRSKNSAPKLIKF